ncbi:hypothetical protein EV421DRAFT_1966784 [Armillaria borealis]|uniref:Uncharacterized protein n=1 Tax=Armillaria borealis TaxID=47425 RepID=A0AA39IEB8_9AGAR|nr:hypothetical protein EV421DRAFT_1966784 [Armillaria borealis]
MILLQKQRRTSGINLLSLDYLAIDDLDGGTSVMCRSSDGNLWLIVMKRSRRAGPAHYLPYFWMYIYTLCDIGAIPSSDLKARTLEHLICLRTTVTERQSRTHCLIHCILNTPPSDTGILPSMYLTMNSSPTGLANATGRPWSHLDCTCLNQAPYPSSRLKYVQCGNQLPPATVIKRIAVYSENAVLSHLSPGSQQATVQHHINVSKQRPYWASSSGVLVELHPYYEFSRSHLHTQQCKDSLSSDSMSRSSAAIIYRAASIAAIQHTSSDALTDLYPNCRSFKVLKTQLVHPHDVTWTQRVPHSLRILRGMALREI